MAAVPSAEPPEADMAALHIGDGAEPAATTAKETTNAATADETTSPETAETTATERSGSAGAPAAVAERPLIMCSATELCKLLAAAETCESFVSAMRVIRKRLSGVTPPVQEFLDGGILPVLLSVIKHEHEYATQHEVMFETLWVLTNVASGTSDQTRELIEAGVVEVLVDILKSYENETILEQAVWAVGNIAGDGTMARDFCISKDVATQLCRLAANPYDGVKVNLTDNLSWALSNICRGKEPPASMDVIRQVLPTVRKLLVDAPPHRDTAMSDACWALTYASDGDNERIDLILGLPDVVPKLVELLALFEGSARLPVVRCIGNLVSGNHTQTQAVIDAGCIPPLIAALENETDAVVKETCWALSNIAAGTQSQIESLLGHGALEPVLRILGHTDEYSVKVIKEALWIVSNLLVGSAVDFRTSLCTPKVMSALCNPLAAKVVLDPHVTKISLEGLHILLRADPTLATVVESFDGLAETIETLSESTESCAEVASTLLAEYLGRVLPTKSAVQA
eukprot:m.379180 g.379180  ORF g.379180 m.379180 type:complete len:514 (-) comp20027_c4_seq30:3095-4636(-)